MGALVVAPPWKALRETPYLSWIDNIMGLKIPVQTNAPDMKAKLCLLSCNGTSLPSPKCVELLQSAVGNSTGGHSSIVAERTERNKRLIFIRADCQRTTNSSPNASNLIRSFRPVPDKRFRQLQFSLLQRGQDLPNKSHNLGSPARPAWTSVRFTLNRC